MQRLKYVLWLVVAGIILASIYTYNYSPKAYAYGYAFAYNKQDFEKVFSYYDQDDVIKKFSKEEIIRFLKEQSNVKKKIKPTELTVVKDEKSKKYVVKFPYHLHNVHILAPAGAKVLMDNNEIISAIRGKGIEIKDILPGKHQVAIEYYDHMYPTFTREINVPEETKVESPYNTHDITVFAPVGSWVGIGNMVRHNQGEKIVFNNMIPGQYDVSVLMGDQDIEVFSSKIQIDVDNRQIHLNDIRGNEALRKDLEAFFLRFNKEYRQGIMEKDATFLQNFLTEKINEDVISDFKMWYIDNKDVTDAKSLMELRDVIPISGNQLKATVLETVYLTNEETDYRIVIEWEYKLFRTKANWEIVSRDILQSVVAYKDDQGKWVKY